MGGNGPTVLGLIPVVQAVVPSYQQFIAGSIVSATISVCDCPSMQAFSVSPVPGTIMPLGASAPAGISVVAARLGVVEYCMQVKCVADSAT